MSVLEKTYKQSGSFFSKCKNSIVSLLKILVRSTFGIKLPQTTEKTCVILGNGPSLKSSLEKNPAFFKNKALVCVNAFSLSATYTDLKPAYYVLLDPSFWESSTDFLSNTLKGIAQKTTWKLQLLLPVQAAKSPYLSEIKANKNIQICYYNYTVYKGFEGLGHMLFKKNLCMPQSQNVLVAAIFLSINLGFKEVFLTGADHTWHESLHVDENNVLCIKDVHFYENETSIKYKPFIADLDTKRTHRVDEIFAIWSKTFYGYIALNSYANYRQVQILNASELSFIDAFKRVKL